MNEPTLAMLRAILSEAIHAPNIPITGTTHLVNDLGIDSMTGIKLLAMIEKKFGIDLDGTDFANAKTVDDVLKLIGETIESS